MEKNCKEDEEKKPKVELLKIEFDPPEIETCQFTEKELEEKDKIREKENNNIKNKKRKKR